jgi:membrane fusion protein (multidrug efflux system)
MTMDTIRRRLAAAFLMVALLAAWGIWFLFSSLGVYAVSDNARLEVAESVQPIEAAVDGRVLAVHAALDAKVTAGQLLVELDSQEQNLQLEEERTRWASARAQIEALRSEIPATLAALEQASRAARLSLAEGRSQATEADASAALAAGEGERIRQLEASGQVSEVAGLRAKTETERRRAAAETAHLAVQRLELELQRRQEAQRTGRSRLERDLAQLEGQMATSAATVARLEHDLELRRIRAPASGRLGEWTKLGVGAMVSKGERLGAVVPDGRVKVVAEFEPAQAVGRVRAGQRAQVRLEGFPWTQFGSLSATVSRVASEPRSGTVRVELLPAIETAGLLPLQHGLPGSVEIEVERVSPVMLVMRGAGRRLATVPTSPSPTSESSR